MWPIQSTYSRALKNKFMKNESGKCVIHFNPLQYGISGSKKLMSLELITCHQDVFKCQFAAWGITSNTPINVVEVFTLMF